MRIALLALLVFFAGSATFALADDAQDIKALDQRWAAAEVSHDQALLEHLLDDRFIATSSSGSSVGKEQFIAGVMKNTSMKSASSIYDRINLYGDTAVVVETFIEQVHRAGQDRSYAAKFTIVYVRRDGEWRAVAEQWSEPRQI